jgi:hypothetical protein
MLKKNIQDDDQELEDLIGKVDKNGDTYNLSNSNEISEDQTNCSPHKELSYRICTSGDVFG